MALQVPVGSYCPNAPLFSTSPSSALIHSARRLIQRGEAIARSELGTHWTPTRDPVAGVISGGQTAINQPHSLPRTIVRSPRSSPTIPVASPGLVLRGRLHPVNDLTRSPRNPCVLHARGSCAPHKSQQVKVFQRSVRPVRSIFWHSS